MIQPWSRMKRKIRKLDYVLDAANLEKTSLSSSAGNVGKPMLE